MTLSEDFDGGPGLPAGWTIDSLPGGETVTVADSRCHITLPAGTEYNSIANATAADETAGITHPILTADVDIAVQCDTDISNTYHWGWAILVFGATDAEACRFSFYQNSAGDEAHTYGYQRAGGVGSSSGNHTQNSRPPYSSAWSWMRVTYASSNGTWTCYGSMDGATWVQIQQAVRAFAPTRVKVSALQYSSNPGGTVRFNKVVDVLAAGTTDLRDPLPEVTTGARLVLDGAAGTLPDGLVDASQNGATVTWTGTAMRLTQQINIDGSSARLDYTGPLFQCWGILTRYTHNQSASNAYGFIGGGIDTGNPGDQYANGPTYGEESAGGSLRRFMRVDPMGGFDDFEAPYTRMLEANIASAVGTPHTWTRIERIGRRIRYRTWLDGTPEPSTWLVDAQDQVNDFPMGLAVSYSHNDGETTEISRSMDVFSLEFYELTEAAENPNAPTSYVLQGGVEVAVQFFVLDSGVETPVTPEIVSAVP